MEILAGSHSCIFWGQSSMRWWAQVFPFQLASQKHDLFMIRFGRLAHATFFNCSTRRLNLTQQPSALRLNRLSLEVGSLQIVCRLFADCFLHSSQQALLYPARKAPRFLTKLRDSRGRTSKFKDSSRPDKLFTNKIIQRQTDLKMTWKLLKYL